MPVMASAILGKNIQGGSLSDAISSASKSFFNRGASDAVSPVTGETPQSVSTIAQTIFANPQGITKIDPTFRYKLLGN